MGIIDDMKELVLPIMDSISDMVGRVIYDYAGIRSSDVVNDVITYIMAAFLLFLLWTVLKRPESVYSYRHRH